MGSTARDGAAPPGLAGQVPDAALAPELGTVVGEYEIERKLGEGAMGAVYAAVHTVLGKRVALKVIGIELSRDAEAIARFRREARVVAQLESPHIVDVFGFGELPDGRAYFVMEYLSGEPLSARLARGRVPLDEALDIIEQTARGLEAAHAAGVVHRDLKPENIFIEKRGAVPIVKLLDFGIVKVTKQDDDIAKTQAGVLVGTPLYVAPEQISHAGEVDYRADIYTLGGVAFELVLGRVPFPYTTIIELVAAHLTALPPSPRSIWPEIPAALDALLTAMLAKEPAKRPTLGHVQDAIEKLRRSAFTRASNVKSNVETPKVPARARRRVWPIAVVGAVVVAAATIVFSSHRSKPTSVRAEGSHDAGVRVSPIDIPPATLTPSAPVQALPASVPNAPLASHTPSARPPTPSAVANTLGKLDITAKPPCNVSIDGVPTGRHTPIAELSVPAGVHHVTFENTRFGITETVDVHVSAGQVAHVIEDYSARIPRVDPNGTIDPFAKGSGR